MCKFFLFFFIFIIAGCTDHLRDQGQQYQNGKILTEFQLSKNQFPIPVNIDAYRKQIKMIKQFAPSLYKKNQSLYQSVEQWISSTQSEIGLNHFELCPYQLSGKDGFGNVQLTGYYTPVLEARHTLTGKYRFPIYNKPMNWEGGLPSRKAIYDGALNGKKLEIAYSSSLIDNFMMEVQGSGYVDFGNNQPLTFFAYNGKNGYPYKSIGRLLIEQNQIKKEDMSMQAIKKWANEHDDQTVINLLSQNDSMVFFNPKNNGKVLGSASVPLIAKASVASDTSLIPTGSVVLIDVPLLDENGKYKKENELRLMVVLDVGSAIKGMHLDMYQGFGKQAEQLAGFYDHYGKVWLLNKSTLGTDKLICID